MGIASVVLFGLIAAQKLVGETLAEHTFLFLGAGEAGTGIPELISLEMLKQPTVLIGTSEAGRTFTKEVVEPMASFNEVLHPSALLVGLLFSM
ncbi:hypothetical protein ACH5RR_036239 [Cinchona calisaya]|uniref:Malic enzyme NAD-binding domain-containing protein n=1 Tax=Cinchona calisaya TaxID=153742 RepID=A0ABD2Y7J5_9GENT